MFLTSTNILAHLITFLLMVAPFVVPILVIRLIYWLQVCVGKKLKENPESKWAIWFRRVVTIPNVSAYFALVAACFVCLYLWAKPNDKATALAIIALIFTFLSFSYSVSTNINKENSSSIDLAGKKVPNVRIDKNGTPTLKLEGKTMITVKLDSATIKQLANEMLKATPAKEKQK